MLYVNYISMFKNRLKEKDNMGYISQENRDHISYFDTEKVV